jgi:hypothetical protein
VTATAAPAAASPAPSAAPVSAQPDPQTALNAANADFTRIQSALARLQKDAGPTTVYGPIHPMPGYGAALNALTSQLSAARDRRDAAQRAVDEAAYHANMVKQWAAQGTAHANDQAAAAQLIQRYLGNGAAQ